MSLIINRNCPSEKSDVVVPKSTIAISMLMLPIMLTCCLANECQVSGLVSLTALLVALAALLRLNPMLSLKYLSVLFAWASTIIGCAVIEYSGIYLSELTVTASYVGSLPLYCLSCWVFFAALVALDLRSDARSSDLGGGSEGSNPFVHYSSIFILLLLIVMFVGVAARPSFLFGLDRFEYGMRYSLGPVEKIANYMGWLIVLPMLSIRGGEKLLGGSCVVLYCLYLLWTGTKFGGFFSILCFVPLVYYDQIRSLDTKRIRPLIMKFGMVFLVLFLLAVVSFTAVSGKAAALYVKERTAQQGQLWWRTFSLTKGAAHLEEFPAEIEATINPKESISDNIGADNGIYKIMYYCAPARLVDNKIASGSRYSSAGYAAAYYYFGMAGPIVFAVAMAVLASKFTNLFINIARNGGVALTVLSARLFRLFSPAASMFLFSELIEPLSLLTYFAIGIRSVFRGSDGRGGSSVKGPDEIDSNLIGIKHVC